MTLVKCARCPMYLKNDTYGSLCEDCYNEVCRSGSSKGPRLRVVGRQKVLPQGCSDPVKTGWIEVWSTRR